MKDRQSNFEPYTGQLLLAGQNGNSRALYHALQEGLPAARRLCLDARLLSKKTVFRGAYTISSFMEGTGTNLRLPLNPPFNVRIRVASMTRPS